MKQLAFGLIVLLMMFAISCSEQELPVHPDAIASDDFIDPDVASSSARKSANSEIVYTFDGMEEVGTAYLNKNGNGFTVNFKTTGLTPGYTYTLWAVVFNEPGNCTGAEGCNEPDIFDPAVVADVIYMAGSVAGNNGKGNFSGHLKEGDVSGSIFPEPNGLIDVTTAEIHFVVRCHGPKIPGEVGEQINTFNGGCPGGVGCVDIQFAVFPPDA